jgi:hypothetical protein
MRWIGVALALGVAAFALANVDWRSLASKPAPQARESISDASRAELEQVLRDSGAGEARKP